MKIRESFSIITSATLILFSIYECLPETAAIKCFIQGLYRYCDIVKHFFAGVLILLGILTIVFLPYDLFQEKHKYVLGYGNKKYYRFFKKWYSQEGSLSIICNDLSWLELDENDANSNVMYDIRTILLRKARAGKLDLFVQQTNGSTVEELVNSGARLQNIPESLTSRYDFSCLAWQGDNGRIIVRKKSESSIGGNKIIVRKINNCRFTI